MNDTYLTVTGNALNTPELKRTTTTNTVVATLRVASHPRRFDQKTKQWVDAPGVRVRVNCWRRLAEHVSKSIKAGDPVIVYGRVFTSEWKTEQGETRVSYEIDAEAVGHNLAMGVASFARASASGPTSMVDDEETESRVHGELVESLPTPDDVGEPIEHGAELGDTANLSASADATADALAILREVRMDPTRTDELAAAGPVDTHDRESAEGSGAGGSDSSAAEGAEGSEDETREDTALSPAGSGGRARRRGRQPVPA